MKNYIGIVRDHSGSMSSIRKAATKDYNDNILAIRDAAISNYLDTIVSVVECGIYGGMYASGGSGIRRAAFYSSVTFLKPLEVEEYTIDGQTPLFDSVGHLIEGFEQAPDKDDPSVSFLIMVVTDGAENASRLWTAARLREKIRELQKSDRWTFVFRVPRGQTYQLKSLGIPEGNIFEWETTTQGMERSSQVTQQAIKSYYTARAAGQGSSSRFYADLSQVTQRDLKATMKNIFQDVLIWEVSSKDNGEMIQHFVERHTRESYLRGAAFYQLMKPETVQDHKRIMIRDKHSGAIYEGSSAREILGLPTSGSQRVHPGNFGHYELFVQSTSNNRKLVNGTHLIYWKGFMRAAA